MALPDFFIAGVPKAGTTALHAALARHPALYMSAVKEPKFFLTDGPPPAQGGPGDAKTYREHVWRRADYEGLFDAASAGQLRGESTPFYLYDLDAQRRLHGLRPDAKLIVVLRDPVERAHSNWQHLRSAALETEADFVALPFDAEAARAFGAASASLRRVGRKTAARAYDSMIAAIAIANDLPIYTCNPDDFTGIERLEVIAVPVPA